MDCIIIKKKKKYEFLVELGLDELNAVPFVNAMIFCKIRLLGGNTFVKYSTRQEVKNHSIKWNASYKFICKMTANEATGILDNCKLRISVRKECNGGKSYRKLGFCDLNLAEFAGSGTCRKLCLLEGYNNKNRQDNSMLKLTINLQLISGDILFKVPSPTYKQAQLDIPGTEKIDIHLSDESLPNLDESNASSSDYDIYNNSQCSSEGSDKLIKLTRPDPDTLVEELVKSIDLGNKTSTEEDTGLQLFVSNNGTMVIKSPKSKSLLRRGTFKKVIVDERK